jgi:hypothetical protein
MRTLLICGLFCSRAFAADYYVIAAGLGGEPEYEAAFRSMAKESAKLLKSGQKPLTGEKGTKAALREAIRNVAASAKPEDTVTVLLFGHGTFDGSVYKLNVPGPDVTADELKGMLGGVKARQLVVLATSCSGAAAETLRSPNRTIVSATRSGTEKNAVVFGRYWVEALRDPSADTDRNESLTAAEAFQYAQLKTANFYETQKRIATEHAVLADSTPPQASRYVLTRSDAARKVIDNPQKRGLLARRDEIEKNIDLLKLEKAALPLEEYKRRLTALLTELAQVEEELER